MWRSRAGQRCVLSDVETRGDGLEGRRGGTGAEQPQEISLILVGGVLADEMCISYFSAEGGLGQRLTRRCHHTRPIARSTPSTPSLPVPGLQSSIVPMWKEILMFSSAVARLSSPLGTRSDEPRVLVASPFCAIDKDDAVEDSACRQFGMSP